MTTTTPTARRSSWPLVIGVLVAVGLSFLAGRASVDELPRRAVAAAAGVAPERQPEGWSAPPPQPGAAQPTVAPSAGPAVAVAVLPAPAPAPRFASPELVEQTRQATTVALQAQRDQIATRCWPEQPGQARVRPRSVTFRVVYDGQGKEMSRSLADESSDLPLAVQACLTNSGDSVQVPAPGMDLAVTATLQLN
jgi:hypothetical protein